jgi:uncharacterized membrane protein HdeD (DUF308 family)
MIRDEKEMREAAAREFQAAAAKDRTGNLLEEIWLLLHHNRKWWLLPLVAVLLLVGGLIVLSSTAIAPFIYTLF